MWLTDALKGIGSAISGLFRNPEARKRAAAALEEAGKIAAQIYPVVEQIAALTPNRTDDQIVACINNFGLMGLVDPTVKDKTDTLHNIALNVAAKHFPGVQGSILSLAIETAYQAFKANAPTKAA